MHVASYSGAGVVQKSCWYGSAILMRICAYITSLYIIALHACILYVCIGSICMGVTPCSVTTDTRHTLLRMRYIAERLESRIEYLLEQSSNT